MFTMNLRNLAISLILLLSCFLIINLLSSSGRLAGGEGAAANKTPEAPGKPDTPAKPPASGPNAAVDYCFGCHEVQEGMSLIYKDDIHYKKGFSCADCHGGDPKINDMNLSKTPEKGFRVRVTRLEVPTFCAGCHSNRKFMARYNPNLPVNQVAIYGKSVHGMKLAAGRMDSAECGDCHGVHNTRPASDPLSYVNPLKVAETCAQCHVETAKAFSGSPHDGAEDTTCVACHGGHAVQIATSTMLTSQDGVCAGCHKATSDAGKAAAEIGRLLANLETAGPDSKEALARARRAAHTSDPVAVKRAIDTATAKSETGIKKQPKP
jgi:hypothetical protein